MTQTRAYRALHDRLDSPDMTIIGKVEGRWVATDRKAFVPIAANALEPAIEGCPSGWWRIRRSGPPVWADLPHPSDNTAARIEIVLSNLARFWRTWEVASFEPLHDTGWAIPTDGVDGRLHAQLFVTGAGEGVMVQSELLARWQAALGGQRPLALEVIAGVPVEHPDQAETRRSVVRLSAPERDDYQAGPPDWITVGYLFVMKTDLPAGIVTEITGPKIHRTLP